MKITLNIESRYIAAMLVCAADQDERPHLNGMHVEVGAHGAKLVATDGARMLIASIQASNPEVVSPVSFIIRRDLLSKVTLKGGVTIEVDYQAGRHEHPVRVIYADGVLEGTTIDAAFPAWRAVTPASVSGEAGQFDPNHMADFAKVAAHLKGKIRIEEPHIRITPNGDRPAWVAFEDETVFGVLMPTVFGVLMPMAQRKLAGVPEGIPSWVRAQA